MEPVRTQILLTTQLLKKAKIVSAQDGSSLSELMRTALQRYLAKWERENRKSSREYIIDSTIGAVALADSGWKGLNWSKEQRKLRRDNPKRRGR